MDYDVVKTSIENAYKYFGKDDGKFYSAMNDFYKEGKKNPSVARIYLQDYITKEIRTAKHIMNKASMMSFPEIDPLMLGSRLSYQNLIYSMSVSNAMRSIQATDIYKNTEYNETTFRNEERKKFDEIWAEKYPRTGKIRERIIQANRIKPDEVTPKASMSTKINYAKTISEYKKDYPKSFNARYALIINGQIKEDEVTPSVKKWFKRFSYKRLIKQGFCFKK